MNHCYLSIDDKVIVYKDDSVVLEDNHFNIEEELRLENEIEKICGQINSDKNNFNCGVFKLNIFHVVSNVFFLYFAPFIEMTINVVGLILLNISILGIKKIYKVYYHKKSQRLDKKYNDCNIKLENIRLNKVITDRINSKVLEQNKDTRSRVVKLYNLRDILLDYKEKSSVSTIDELWNLSDIVDYRRDNSKVNIKKM